MSKAKYFWNRMANSYDEQVNRKYKKAYSDTIEQSKMYLQPDFSALDLACGTGITTIALGKYVERMDAIDISDKMIEIAKVKAEKEQVNTIDFTVTDIYDKEFDGKIYNAIFAFNILYFLADVDEVLERIKALLSHTGVFISVTDCLGEKKSIKNIILSVLSTIGFIPYMKFYFIQTLERDIRHKGFEIITTQNLNDDPPNYFIVAQKKIEK